MNKAGVLFTKTNVDTSQHAGSRPEHTAAWSDWAIKRAPELRAMQQAGLLGSENRAWRNVAEHCLVVNATAMFIATHIKVAGTALDSHLIDQGSMLHDATKRLEKEQGVGYSNEHGSPLRKNFLSLLGYPEEVIAVTEYTGRVPEMFIQDTTERHAAIQAQPLEQLVVAYADARVRNVNIVPLEQARDMNKQKVPADATVYDQWYDFYHDVENRIFATIGRNAICADSLNNDAVITMVQQTYQNNGA